MSVRIQLDQDPSAPYTNLDFISGRVILVLSSDATISAVNVKLEAESRTRLMPPRERPDRKRAELEVHKLLYLVQTIFPPREIQDGNSQYSLPAGQHTYPFRFKFPINNDCTKSTSLLNDLTLGMAGAQFKHVKKTLPPSLAGFPGMAEIKYYVKATVVRPKFYQENLRTRVDIRFMPVEDPRPPARQEEMFARRKQQFQQTAPPPEKRRLFKRSTPAAANTQPEPPTVQVEARLPSPPIVTCHEPLPLRVLVQRLGDVKATIVLRTLQIELVAYTNVRSNDLTRTEVGTWILISRANLNIPFANLNDKLQSEWTLPSRLWDGFPLPDSVAPSFETCNISRRYELDIRVGLSYTTGSSIRPELLVLPLKMPVKVFSGIRPPPELLGRMAPGQQGLQVPVNGYHPDPDVPNTPIYDHSAQPAPVGSQLPPQLDIPDEAPPSYEDAMAEDLAPIDGPRRHYSVPETEQQTATQQASKPDVNRGESGSAAAATSSTAVRERSSTGVIDLGDGAPPQLPARTATGKKEVNGDGNSSGTKDKGKSRGKLIREV
ncbi:hypothetical protein DV735_g3678, partial [Chaetothyriales sp. CBS 134920]